MTEMEKFGFILMGIGSFLMLIGFLFYIIGNVDSSTSYGLIVLGTIIFFVGFILLYLGFHKTIRLNSSPDK